MFKVFFRKVFIINFGYYFMILIFFLNSFKNYLMFFFNQRIKNFYLPNYFIRNIIIIDPMKIKYVTSIPMKFNKSSKFILDFDWDKKNKLLLTHEKEHHTYVACRELFIEGIKIEKCKEYLFFKEQILKYKEFKNCKNENDIISYFKKLIKLFESIKKIGLKKNINNNIEFMVDRNHNLVKINSGNHRFSISRILKLKKIPIEIKVIHEKCLKKNLDEKIKISQINKIIKNIERKYN